MKGPSPEHLASPQRQGKPESGPQPRGAQGVWWVRVTWVLDRIPGQRNGVRGNRKFGPFK